MREDRDETRGSGKINPRHYKGDVITQVWLDSRMLATLSVYLDTEGVMTRFLSEVVREILEMVVVNLVRDDRVKMVDDTDKAREILRTRYRLNLNPRNKKGRFIGGKNLAHNQILSGRIGETGNTGGYNPKSRFMYKVENKDEETEREELSNEKVNHNLGYDKSKPLKHESSIDEAFRRCDEEDEKQRKEDIETFKTNCDVDENGNFMPKGEPYGTITEKDMKEYEEREKKREREEELNKKDRRLERREEKLLNKQDDLNEEENKDG